MILESRETAPLAKFRAERVRDPDAGMPPVTAAATLAMPTLSMSWFTSGRSPARLARVLDITEFSREARKAIEKARPVRREMSEKKPRSLISGRLGARSETENESKVATCHPPSFWRR